MPIDPANDPNEAYDIGPANWRQGWLTATCNGIPVCHFSPSARAEADRYVVDPEYRLSLVSRYIHA
jgi:hypothetical protein